MYITWLGHIPFYSDQICDVSFLGLLSKPLHSPKHSPDQPLTHIPKDRSTAAPQSFTLRFSMDSSRQLRKDSPFCCWGKSSVTESETFYIDSGSQSKQWIFISVTQGRYVSSQLSLIRAVCCVCWLTVTVLPTSWWPYTSDPYRTMDNTYISKQKGGHSNLTGLLLLLYLAGNTRIFLLTKILRGKSNFSCDNMVLWHSVPVCNSTAMLTYIDWPYFNSVFTHLLTENSLLCMLPVVNAVDRELQCILELVLYLSFWNSHN